MNLIVNRGVKEMYYRVGFLKSNYPGLRVKSFVNLL